MSYNFLVDLIRFHYNHLDDLCVDFIYGSVNGVIMEINYINKKY